MRVIFCLFLFFGLFGNKKENAILKYIKNGNQFYKEKDYKLAAQHYKSALELDSVNAIGLNNYGVALYKLKDYKNAIGSFTLATIRLNDLTHRVRAFHNLGNAYYHQKDFQNAMTAYKSALKLIPNDQNTRYNLILTMKRLQKKSKEDEKDKKNQDKKDKEKENQDKKDKEKKDQDKENQDKKEEQKKDKQDDKKEKETPQQKMNKEQEKRLMQALKNEEQKVQQKLYKGNAEAQQNGKNGKDW